MLRADGFKPVKTAVVHLIDKESLLKPILIGPQYKIESVAKVNNVDLEDYQVINVEHSHEAAKKSRRTCKEKRSCGYYERVASY